MIKLVWSVLQNKVGCVFVVRERLEREKALALKMEVERAAREKERREQEQRKRALEERRRLVRETPTSRPHLALCWSFSFFSPCRRAPGGAAEAGCRGEGSSGAGSCSPERGSSQAGETHTAESSSSSKRRAKRVQCGKSSTWQIVSLALSWGHHGSTDGSLVGGRPYFRWSK